MESLWILPLYFVFPISGIILLISGIIQYKNHKKITRIFAGLFFLSLPILHLILMQFYQTSLESKIVGNYYIEGENVPILIIKADSSFELVKNPKLTKSGIGKWEIYRWDIIELDLHFNNSQESEVSFEIFEKENTIELESTPFTNSNIKLVKK